MFLTENWFWRGTQSAVFYYASMSPCVEYRHKKKRRQEAERAQKERAATMEEQPGFLAQPAPFQTNEYWAEEILAGPGPPRGWKKDKLRRQNKIQFAEGLSRTAPKRIQPLSMILGEGTEPRESDDFVDEEGEQLQRQHTRSSHKSSGRTRATSTNSAPSHGLGITSGVSSTLVITPTSDLPEMPPKALLASSSLHSSSDPESRRSSFESSMNSPVQRPSIDRRLSAAMDNIRGHMKIKIHPDQWNWIRYDREDEVLWGLNSKVSRMWDRVTNAGTTLKDDIGEAARDAAGRGIKKPAPAAEDQVLAKSQKKRQNWPAWDRLHPTVVSNLPSSRAEAQWMTLPPPSADVMAGRRRPGAEPSRRWAMAQVGGEKHLNSQVEEIELETPELAANRSRKSSRSETHTPDLSTSSEETWSDEDSLDAGESSLAGRRRSAPVPGWVPIWSEHIFTKEIRRAPERRASEQL